jgi:serine/threonine protein kinase
VTPQEIIIKNRYQLGAKIKEETTGTLYRGVDLTTKKEVSIKRYRPQLLSLPLVEKLQESCFRLAAVNHPALLIPSDNSLERKNFFIVQELVEDEETVADVLRKLRSFTVESSLLTIKELAPALSYLHRKKICHGNLTPADICILKDGSLLIKNTLLDAVISHAAVKKGVLLPFPGFKAPEQLQDEPTRPQSDIWAVGVLLYVLLTGETPFKESHDRAEMLHNLSAKPVLPTLRNPKIPKYLEDLILACLRISPEQRPSSLADFLEQLESKKVKVRLSDITAPKQRKVVKAPTTAPLKVPIAAQFKKGLKHTTGFINNVYQKTRATVMTPELEATIQAAPEHLPRRIRTMADRFEEMMEERKKKPGLFRKPKTTTQKVLVYGTVVFAVGIITALSQTLFLGYFTSIPEIDLPDLRNLPMQQAFDILESKGLKGKVVGELTNSTVPVDHVISQKPEAGRVVKKDRIINLYVSKGVGETKVPEVTGHDLDQAKALFSRNNLGLEVIQSVYSASVQKNYVIKQNPEADVVVQKNTTVNIIVSNGYPVTLTLKDRSPQNCIVDAVLMVPADWPAQKVKLLLTDSRGTRTVVDQTFLPEQQKKVQLVAEDTALVEVYYNDQIALKQSFAELQDTEDKDNIAH